MIIIREADKDDAGQIAPLINIIYDEMELAELDDVPARQWQRVLRKAYSTDEYLSTMASTLVAEDTNNNKVVGVAFGYADGYEQPLDDILTEYADDEHIFDEQATDLDPDIEAYRHEWYLDSIAVDPAYQGHGIGSKLLQAIPKVAGQEGESVIGLNVDFANPAAKKLYTKNKFISVGVREIGDHMYFHMQKPVQMIPA